jgi:PAS domain S-box-containing protein
MAQQDPLSNSTRLGSKWADAMRAAITLARHANGDENEYLQVVSRELEELEMGGMIMLLTAEGWLEIKAAHPFSANQSEKQRMDALIGSRFDPQEQEVFHQILKTRESMFEWDGRSILNPIFMHSTNPQITKTLKGFGNHPMIIVPLSAGERPLGVMNVIADWFTSEDLSMVVALADHIAIHLHQLRYNAEMRSALLRERLGIQVANVASSLLDLHEVFDHVFHLLADATGADAGVITLIDSETQMLRCKYLYGLPQEVGEYSISADQGLIWKMIKRGEPVLINNYAQEADALPVVIELGIQALISAPLITGNEVIGVIGLAILDPDRVFDEEDLENVVAVSHVAAGVIRTAQLYEEATKHAEEAEALRRGSIAISSSLDYRIVLMEICEQAKKLLEADGSRIHLLDPETGLLQCVIALQPHADEVMQLKLKPGEGLTGSVFQNGKALLVNRPIDHPNSLQVPGTPDGEAEALALAPMNVRKRTMGVMTVRRVGYDHPFSESDLHLLKAFASQAAVAIENAHLYGQIESQAQYLEDEVKERTRALTLSEARYRSLVESSLTGIYQLGDDLCVTYVNRQIAEMLGFTPEEMIGQSVDVFLAPEYREDVLQRASRRLDGKSPPTEIYEVELLSQSGGRIPVILAAGVVENESGSLESLTGLVLDISTQKSLEAALRTERDRLEVILSNVGDAVVVTDSSGIIEFVNPAWEHLNGYTTEEALGKSSSLVKSDYQDQVFYIEMWDTILSGRIWRGEVINCRKDSSLYEAALTITPVLDEGGNIVNFVGVHHDISILKEVDRLKSQFVSDVSHELRTPLTNIRLYLDLLKQTEYDQRASRYIKTLSRESDRLSSLIEDLLSLSRLESDSVTINNEPVDINRLLGALVDDRELLAAKHGLELRMEREAKLPLVLGDELLLGQLFTNLLTNALNYTPEGGRVILRTWCQKAGKTKWVVTEVEDTGYGISPNERHLIFRRFFRGQASKPSKVPGTGLGLAICKEITERHGGRINVDSEGIPGKGSCFSVWLPAV